MHMINLTCTLQKLLPNLEKLDLSYNYIENIENLAVSHLSCCSVCMYSISTKNSAQKITSKLSWIIIRGKIATFQHNRLKYRKIRRLNWWKQRLVLKTGEQHREVEWLLFIAVDSEADCPLHDPFICAIWLSSWNACMLIIRGGRLETFEIGLLKYRPVSYTHLTLPTIYSV